MATTTTYTTDVTVPIYASWKCEKCGETNFSTGVIGYRAEVSTNSCRKSVREKAKLEASTLAENEWRRNVYKIITDPNHSAESLRNDLFLQNTNCAKCGEKPSWDKNMKYLKWAAISFICAVLSGIVAFSEKTSFVGWLIFLASLSGVIYGFATESRYKKTMINLPKEYTPVIGTLNEDVIEYTTHRGKTVPTPEESIQIVKNYGRDC
ncbi:MAG: hypothetical protein E7406_01945 [Ruminococcaceae bacterium]|nr:hypothetical protein [Oscillospiraceae bacterium]